jgi:hypothetical protein
MHSDSIKHNTNNISLTPKQYEARIQPWIWPEQKDEPCSLGFEVSKDSSLALKFSDFLKAEEHSDSSVEAALVGKRGRRLKIKKPEKFLREEVLTQPDAKDWIKKQASILFKSFWGNYKFRAPEIWMCTGVQLVTGGDVHVGASRSVNETVAAKADVGAAAGSPPKIGEVGVEVTHGHSGRNNNDYGHEDERVWAAQFMQVKIEYGDQGDKNPKTSDTKVVPAEITTFWLEDIADLKGRGIRGGLEQRAAANGLKKEKAPEPIGNIVVGEEEEEEEEQDEGIELSDKVYVEELKETDWEMYDKCSLYLVHAQTGRRSPSPEPLKS